MIKLILETQYNAINQILSDFDYSHQFAFTCPEVYNITERTLKNDPRVRDISRNSIIAVFMYVLEPVREMFIEEHRINSDPICKQTFINSLIKSGISDTSYHELRTKWLERMKDALIEAINQRSVPGSVIACATSMHDARFMNRVLTITGCTVSEITESEPVVDGDKSVWTYGVLRLTKIDSLATLSFVE